MSTSTEDNESRKIERSRSRFVPSLANYFGKERIFRILYASLARLFVQFVEEWPETIVFGILLSGKRSVYAREIYEDDST